MLILDTNVIIQNYKNLLNFDETIILPLAVIKELDKFKTEYSDRGYHARNAIKLIDKAMEAEYDNQYFLNNNELILDSEQFKELNNDDQILNCCSKYPLATLITNDLSLRIRANALNIQALKYNECKIIDDIGNIKTYEVEQVIIDRIYKDNKIDERIIEQQPQNQCIILKSNESSVSVLVRRYNEYLIKINSPKIIYNCVEPKNAGQKFLADMIQDDNIKIVIASGKSGSGRSLISLASSLQLINSSKPYSKIVCFKSLDVVGKEIGFLSGSLDEKLKPHYESFNDSIYYIADKLNRMDYYEKGFSEIDFQPIGFVRGRTFDNSILLIDEAQNLSLHVLKTLISRAGKNSKVIILGDMKQIDNDKNTRYNNGLYHAQLKLYDNKYIGMINLDKVERSLITELSEKL